MAVVTISRQYASAGDDRRAWSLPMHAAGLG